MKCAPASPQTAAATSPVLSSKAYGRAAQVDITGSRIALVDQAQTAGSGSAFTKDVLQIEGAGLSRLNSSVLIGGKRSDTPDGIQITTSASEVVVANSSAGAVVLPELMLAATNTIDVRAGSVLSAVGTATDAAPKTIASETSGALLRLSSGKQTRIERAKAVVVAPAPAAAPAEGDAPATTPAAAPEPARGDVRIAKGAVVSASASVLIDATKSTESQGQLRVGGEGGVGGSLALSSGQVNLGDTARASGKLTGLVLSNADLAALKIPSTRAT